MRRGFTIVELLMVVAIISVLTTIVINAASSSVHSARSKRTQVMKSMFETAIATYRAQDSNGKWPQQIESLAEQGESAVLSESAAQEVFRKIVMRSTGHDGTVNPLLDPRGLFVARSGIQDGRGSGLSYSDARQGDGRNRQAIGPSQMVFGYQGTLTGRFHRFNIIYRAQSDSVEVTTCCHECADPDGCKKEKGGDTPCPVCHAGE